MARLSRSELRRRRKRNQLIVLIILLAALIGVLVFMYMKEKQNGNIGNNTAVTTSAETEMISADIGEESSDSASNTVSTAEEAIEKAESQATQYDYEGAIETLKSVEDYESNDDILDLISDYQEQIDALVSTSPSDVTHIFFHTLVVDPERGFSLTGNSTWDAATPGFCQWMTTVDEFNAIIQQMYDRGYVLVSLYDMVDITTDENGVEHVTAKDIKLPEGKTPFVLSLDDLSYYHSYDGRGCATKLVIGDDGKPTCEYVTESGKTVTGSYDCVPLLDDFLEEHPDFSYKGAKGTIALTGYDGIFGYRTAFNYRDLNDLTEDQEEWLDEHPDFDFDEECEQAKEVAECLKADGWTLGSHTWGHIRVGDSDLDRIKTDTQKWEEQVAPLIGGSDIIIFAHGQDLAAWNEDYASTEKFQYLKSQGFTIYCNVDSSQYFVQIGDEYLRMGRRNLDGYRLWEAVYGDNDRVSDLIDAASVFDPERPTDASLYGQDDSDSDSTDTSSADSTTTTSN